MTTSQMAQSPHTAPGFRRPFEPPALRQPTGCKSHPASFLARTMTIPAWQKLCSKTTSAMASDQSNRRAEKSGWPRINRRRRKQRIERSECNLGFLCVFVSSWFKTGPPGASPSSTRQSPDAGPEAIHARRILVEELDEALEELPDAQREIFIAHELEGRTFKDMAAETGAHRMHERSDVPDASVP
jgi:hypothetical protein